MKRNEEGFICLQHPMSYDVAGETFKTSFETIIADSKGILKVKNEGSACELIIKEDCIPCDTQ